MPKFIVNSAILRSGKDPKACATGAAKMLTDGKITDVAVKACYCCTYENRVAFLVDAASQEVVLAALEKIDLPVAAIMEVQEVSAA